MNDEKATKNIAMSPVVQSVATFLTVGGIDMLAHLGPTGIVIGAIGAFVAYRHGNDIVTYVRSSALLPPSEVAEDEAQEETTYYAGERSFADRLLGRYPQTPLNQPVTKEEGNEDDNGAPARGGAFWESRKRDDDELAPPRVRTQMFSDILRTFAPSLSRIYLATLPDGTPAFCSAKDLCHVAIAGRTRHGKSSITRLLMSQLCAAGAAVLLLDPHYTPYDVETGEDWTPFIPYMVHDPIECCNYPVIERYLAHIAEKLIPARLAKRRAGQKLGKPYFLVLDELPDIVANVKGASGYLKKILREGGKVGVFVIASSQDFLVKTIFPEGDGAVRACYLTAYDVGGDPATSRTLLGIPSKQMPAIKLGKGPVMLRCHSIEQATLAYVPLTDNEALYTLLGPSTYKPSHYSAVEDENEMYFSHPVPAPVQHCTSGTPMVPEIGAQPERTVPIAPHNSGYGNAVMTRKVAEDMEDLPMRQPTAKPPIVNSRVYPVLAPELRQAFDAYQSGMSHRELGPLLGVSHVTAGKYIQRLKDLRLIDAGGKKKVW